MSGGETIHEALLAAAPGSGRFLRFRSPVGSFAARAAGEVEEVLARVERAAVEGLWAVGFVAYEAAPGFDPALAVRAGAAEPLALFGLFGAPEEVELAPAAAALPGVERIRPTVDEAQHCAAVERVRAAIAAGETYQVNLTFALEARTSAAPETLFAALARAARAPYAAFLDLGARAILSLSPELFFERIGDLVRMRPMKGTRARGRFAEEDRALAAELAAAEKDRAENLMIVDMARNDLGRVARPGSVAVPRLFEIERYPTVWQATSTVEARSAAPLPDLFRALFPCCSVTGAPKAATMRWVARLEREPRGVYCGAIGRVAPGGDARFAVAIRTAELERATGRLRYGVGSGIVWDSDPTEEWRECLAKGRALAPPAEPPALFETILWHPRRGALRLERHLARLAASAERLGFPCDLAAARDEVARAGAGLPPVPHRLRLELASSGALEFAATPFRRARRPWTVALVGPPVDPEDLLLFHKTTRRAIYDEALDRARALGADEPLLANDRGELTEGARTNLVVELDGRRLTSRRECGLLAGIFRSELVERGRVEEATLRLEDLRRARRVWLVNALRGWIPVAGVVDGEGRPSWPVAADE